MIPICRLLVGKAKEGDLAAMRLVLDRVFPVRDARWPISWPILRTCGPWSRQTRPAVHPATKQKGAQKFSEHSKGEAGA